MDQRKQLEQLIIEKAMKDEDFRQQLIEDPKFILAQETGIKIPDSLNIKVLVEDAQTIYLILPPNLTDSDDMELTEAEIEGVSGGWGDRGPTVEISCILSECYN